MALLDLFKGQKSIDNANGHIQGFREQSELAMYINYPLNQECTGSVLNFTWKLDNLKVIRINLVNNFFFTHSSECIMGILRHELRVSDIELIAHSQSFEQVFSVLLHSLSAQLIDFLSSLTFILDLCLFL